jgi:DNA-binding response OmpR family regulator
MGLSILIAGEDAELCQLLQESFYDAGFEVWTTDSSAQALELLESGLPDALVMDVTTPGALKVIRKVRQSLNGQKANILLLGDDERTAYESPEASLADMVLMKPLSVSNLVMQVRRMIDSTIRSEANGQALRSELRAYFRTSGQ